VILKRFLAPDLVFILGILLSDGRESASQLLCGRPRSDLNELKKPPRQPYRPGGLEGL
jgi:hypothetical protein